MWRDSRKEGENQGQKHVMALVAPPSMQHTSVLLESHWPKESHEQAWYGWCGKVGSFHRSTACRIAVGRDVEFSDFWGKNNLEQFAYKLKKKSRLSWISIKAKWKWLHNKIACMEYFIFNVCSSKPKETINVFI